MTHTHDILLREFKARIQAGIEGVSMEESCLLVCILDCSALSRPPCAGGVSTHSRLDSPISTSNYKNSPQTGPSPI